MNKIATTNITSMNYTEKQKTKKVRKDWENEDVQSTITESYHHSVQMGSPRRSPQECFEMTVN